MAEAGARFESYVREAMAEAEIPSLAQLARDSGIASSAWHGWFNGRRTPRRNSLKLAGDVLDRTPEQLVAAWDGGKPYKARRATETPDPVVAAIEALSDRLAALLDGQEARLRALETEAGLHRAPPEDAVRPRRSAPRGTRG